MLQNKGADFSFLFITGFILVAGLVCSLIWVQSVSPATQQSSGEASAAVANAGGGFWARFHQGRRVRLAVVPTQVAEAAPENSPEAVEPVAGGETDLAAVTAAINAGGCVACHTIPNIPGAIGQVGPNLSNIGVDAGGRIEGYTAEAYIHESLVSPNAFTAPECPTGPCPFGAMPNLLLSDAQIETIVSYLTTLGVSP